MEYVGSWVFNRGQEITLRKGPKSYWVAVQLFNSAGHPFKYLTGKDRDRLLYRAMAMVARDVAKDRQELVLMEQEGLSLPFKVKTEDEQVRELVETIKREDPEIFRKMHMNILRSLPEHKVVRKEKE